MKKINDKEINKFLRQFSPERAEIDIAFVENLEKRIKREYSPRSIFTPFLKLGLVTVMIISIFIFSQAQLTNPTSQTSRQVFSVSNRNRDEILLRLDREKVLPLIEESISRNDFAILTASAEIKNSEIDVTSFPISFTQEPPFLEIKESMFRGEKYGICEAITERYSDGEVILSRFYKSGDSFVKSEEYINIIEEDQKIPDIKGVSTIISFPTLISYPLVENYNITEGIIIDQKRYYILQVERMIDSCDNLLLYRFMISEESLSVTEIEVFTGGVTISDLVFKTYFTHENI